MNRAALALSALLLGAAPALSQTVGGSAFNNFETNVGTFTQNGTVTAANTSTLDFFSGAQSMRITGSGGSATLNGVVAAITANVTYVITWYYEQAVGTFGGAVITGFSSGTGLASNTYQTTTLQTNLVGTDPNSQWTKMQTRFTSSTSTSKAFVVSFSGCSGSNTCARFDDIGIAAAPVPAPLAGAGLVSFLFGIGALGLLRHRKPAPHI